MTPGQARRSVEKGIGMAFWIAEPRERRHGVKRWPAERDGRGNESVSASCLMEHLDGDRKHGEGDDEQQKRAAIR